MPLKETISVNGIAITVEAIGEKSLRIATANTGNLRLTSLLDQYAWLEIEPASANQVLYRDMVDGTVSKKPELPTLKKQEN